MIGITEITKKIADQSKVNKLNINRSQIEQIVNQTFEVLQDSLRKDEVIFIKGRFTLKRARTKSKGNTKCDNHIRSMNEIKNKIKAKGGGLSAYAKDPQFRKITAETKICKHCQVQRAKVKKSSTPLNRIIFKPSEGFLN